MNPRNHRLKGTGCQGLRQVKLEHASYGCPGWAEQGQEVPAGNIPAGSVKVDFAILGSGFTGLAAARELATLAPGKRIALLEAGRIGFGTSGRSSGFVMDIAHYESVLGVRGNQRLRKLGLAGIAHLQQIVSQHKIPCEWTATGCLRGAASDRGLRCLEEFAAGMEKLGESAKWLTRNETARITGSQFYRAAIYCPDPVLVQPFKLLQGLAASMPPEVEIYEDTPVVGLHLERPIRLDLPRGEVVTHKLLITGNGFLPHLGLLKRRIIPLVTFASLTRSTATEGTPVGGHTQWGLIPEERIGTTVRKTSDGRILIRNGVAYHPRLGLERSKLKEAWQAHRSSLTARYPMLEHIPFEATWAGVLGMTLNNTPFFGPMPGYQRVFVAAGMSGVGIALGTMAGKLLADLCLGSDNQELDAMRKLPDPWALPPSLVALGAPLLIKFMCRRGKAEI